MSQFRPSYDKVFSKNKLDDYEYKPPPQHGVIEGALLKRKSKKWPLKDARWKRYWVVADGTTLRYFRNERQDDDELRKLKPSIEISQVNILRKKPLLLRLGRRQRQFSDHLNGRWRTSALQFRQIGFTID